MKEIIYITALIVFAVLLFSPLSTFALESFNIWHGTEQNNIYGSAFATGTGTCNVYGYCTFCQSIIVTRNIINFLVGIASALAVALLVWGSLKIIVSGPRPQLIEDGKKTITSALIGLLIVLGSWVIVNTLLHIIVGEGVDFPWNEIECS